MTKWALHYEWAKALAGDCHNIKRHMPDRLDGKVIVTNPSTPDDGELFGHAGINCLISSTPVHHGRSFGTNMMEAGLAAICGKSRPLTRVERTELIEHLNLEPKLQGLS